MLNKSKTFKWDNVDIPMVERGCCDEDKIDTFHASKKKSIPKEDANKAEILDAKYEKIDFTEVIKND